jgi:FSR family fosmidomycin resistance protein-like MFS transporter
MIKLSSGNKVGTGMSFFMVGGELARTLGPLIATAAVSWWGLEGVYKLIPIGLIASLILYVKLKDFDMTVPLSKPKEKGDTKILLKKYFPLFVVIGLFILFQAGLKSALTLYLPVYLVNQGESLWFAGISLSILQFSGVIGALGAGHISDKIGRQSTLALSSIGSVVSAALFIHFNSIFILPFVGLFILSTGPVLMATIQDTNSHMPTFMNSMYMSVNFGVGSIIVFGVGLLGDNVGLNLTYIICNVLAIGCIPMAFLLNRYIR